MSGQSLIMFVSVLAIALAANRAEDTSWTGGTIRSERGPASLAGKKDISLLEKEVIKRTHKIRGPLAVAVELLGERPQRAGDVFVLKGAIAAETPLNNVEFVWAVPPGVEIVNGQTSSTIAVLSEGKPYETQITLRQTGSENVRVTLRVRGASNGMRFGDTAVYHTMDQQKLEASRKELKKTAEDYILQEKKLKIFH